MNSEPHQQIQQLGRTTHFGWIHPHDTRGTLDAQKNPILFHHLFGFGFQL